MGNLVPEISPKELAQELGKGHEFLLIDVREEDELEISRLPGIMHIPLSNIMTRLSEIDPSADIVMICRTGGRSARATSQLIISGFKKVRNLSTGMNGWARDVDPSVIQY